MATVTKTTVDVTIGDYSYEARLDGNAVEIFRDGMLAGHGTWTGRTIEDFPENVSEEAHEALDAAIRRNLHKAWRAAPEADGDDRWNAIGPTGPADGSLTQDAANQGQMGNEANKPSRQGEKEVGTGGPGRDPNTGEIGGQARRRAVGDGFRRPPDGAGRR